MQRLVKGLVALLALVVMVAGVPVALVLLGGNPLPDQLGAAEIWQALTEPASDRVLVGFLTIVGWVAWALFTVSVVVEAINLVSGYRLRIRLPGLRIGQQLTAGLIIAIIAMLGAAQLAGTLAQRSNTPAAPPPAAVATTTPGHTGGAPLLNAGAGAAAVYADTTRPLADVPAAEPAGTAVTAEPSNSHQRVHVVEEGDFLWTLAERYLGDGTEWPQIVRANGLTSTVLQPGQRLIIPTTTTSEQGRTVTVRAGDSLSGLAQRLWGDPGRWTELWQANQAQIPDPDQIEIGQVLTIPATSDPGTSQDKQTGQHTEPRHDDDRDKQSQQKTDKDHQTDQQTPDRDTTDQDVADRDTTDRQAAEERTAPQRRTPGGSTTAPQPTTATPQTDESAGQLAEEQVVAAAASVGLLLAAGLVATLAVRRRRQLAARRPGQAPASPAEPALELESRARRVEDPLTIAQLDQALRSIAGHAADTTGDLPDLVAARIGENQIHLLHREPTSSPPPPGVTLAADGSVWVIEHADLPLLLSSGSLATTAHPWPALVTLGRASDDAHVLLNLEAVGALTISADTPDQVRRAITTLAAELTVSPWSAELTITLAGTGAELAAAFGHPRIRHVDDLDTALDELEQTAAEQRPFLDNDDDTDAAGSTVGSKRLDVDLADAWAPHLLLIAEPMDEAQAGRVADLVTSLPRVAIAAATTGTVPHAWRYRLGGEPLAGQLTVALHEELEWELAPTMLSDDDLTHLVDLIGSTADTEFDPAPWWHTDQPTADHDILEHHNVSDSSNTGADMELDPDEPDPPVTTHTVNTDRATAPGDNPKPAVARWRRPLSHPLIDLFDPSDPAITEPADFADPEDDAAADTVSTNATAATTVDEEQPTPPDPEAGEAPMLRIFGVPEISGAAGKRNQNPGRCMEILLSLLERPGRTNRQIADALALAPATTRSVITFLRAWLGTAPDGTKWLPDAHPGRGGYRTNDRVTSDWHQAQLLVGRAGINHANPEVLQQTLAMVRGKPLEGTIDWSSVDHLKSQISAFLEEASHQLTSHALDQGNLGLARWSNGQGLLADPESERLLTDKIIIADRAGDHDEVQRLIGKVSANARALELDLSDDTQDVLSALTRS